ncbi:MAG: hypothetical protein ACRD3Z_00015 [Nitrososphaerales archaeon]
MDWGNMILGVGIIVGLLFLIASSHILNTVNLAYGESTQGSKDLVPANLGIRFQLKIDQTAFIESENVKVTFLNVTEDSRCPADAVCVWEGQVTVLLNVMRNEEDLGDFDLTLRGGDKNLAIKTFDGYSIQLLKVDPYPFASQPTELTDYVATLQVSELELEQNVSVAIKTTKKITLLAIKNAGDAADYSVKIKADSGDLNFVKARGWGGEQIDASTVMIKTDDRPVMKGRVMVVLLLLDDRNAGLEWTAFDTNASILSSGTLIL